MQVNAQNSRQSEGETSMASLRFSGLKKDLSRKIRNYNKTDSALHVPSGIPRRVYILCSGSNATGGLVYACWIDLMREAASVSKRLWNLSTRCRRSPRVHFYGVTQVSSCDMDYTLKV